MYIYIALVEVCVMFLSCFIITVATVVQVVVLFKFYVGSPHLIPLSTFPLLLCPPFPVPDCMFVHSFFPLRQALLTRRSFQSLLNGGSGGGGGGGGPGVGGGVIPATSGGTVAVESGKEAVTSIAEVT